MLAALRRLFSRLRSRLRRADAAPPEPEAPRVDRAAVEALVGHPIVDEALYEQAFRHRSILRNQGGSPVLSNERLEFLGDAVLGFVVAEHLYAHFPRKDEGFLTRLRAKLVNGQALARSARKLDMGRLVLLSENMESSGGRENTTILADAFEAVIGALYLDAGIEPARAFIHRTMLDEVDLDALGHRRDNFKSLLLEFAQARGWEQPEYRVADEEGPSHEKRFTVEVFVRGEAMGRGTAGSKKKAEQIAAGAALDRLQDADA